ANPPEPLRSCFGDRDKLRLMPPILDRSDQRLDIAAHALGATAVKKIGGAVRVGLIRMDHQRPDLIAVAWLQRLGCPNKKMLVYRRINITSSRSCIVRSLDQPGC